MIVAKKSTRKPCEGQPPTMTRVRFGDYVRALAPLMRLGHWDIESSNELPASQECWASIVRWDSKYAATLRVADALLTQPESLLRECAVHELIHCHWAHADHISRGALGSRDLDVWTLANEYAVSAMARVVAPTMPLPSEILDGKGK